MRYQIIGVIIGALLGLAIAQACSTTQTPPAQSEDSVKQCATICTAIAAAHCWDSRVVEHLLGPAVEAFNCYEKCQAKAQFAIGIDFECLKTATVCEALDECIDTGYKKVSLLRPAPRELLPPSPEPAVFFYEAKMVDLHERIADGFAAADGVAEDLYKQFTERYADLIANTKNRDEQMWADLGAPFNITMGMLDLVPVQQRMASDEWSSTMTGMIAASRRQAFIEVMAKMLLDVRDKHIHQAIDAAQTMSRAELKQAAKIPNETFRTAAERRKISRV